MHGRNSTAQNEAGGQQPEQPLAGCYRNPGARKLERMLISRDNTALPG